jgi:hypothetical protein
MDPTYYVKTFVAVNREKTEMWVCYPTTGSTSCNRALIWNWQNGSWSIRDLPDIHYIANGILPSDDPYIWSVDTETWAEDTTAWDERSYNPTVVKNMGVSNDTTYVFDSGYTFDGNSYSSYVEKQWITLGSPDTIKRIKSVYIKGKGEMNVYVGHAMHQYDAFTWEGPYNLDPSLDAQIRCRVTGRYHAIRFEFVGDSEHSIQGYDIEYVDTGYGR